MLITLQQRFGNGVAALQQRFDNIAATFWTKVIRIGTAIGTTITLSRRWHNILTMLWQVYFAASLELGLGLWVNGVVDDGMEIVHQGLWFLVYVVVFLDV